MTNSYVSLSTPSDWGGEYGPHPCQQFLYHMNYFQQHRDGTATLYDSSGHGRHGTVNGWGTSANLGNGEKQRALLLSASTELMIPYFQGMWPESGSFALGFWVQSTWLVGDKTQVTAKNPKDSNNKMFRIYSDRAQGSDPVLMVDFYARDGETVGVIRITQHPLPHSTWIWINLEVDYAQKKAILRFWDPAGYAPAIQLQPFDSDRHNRGASCALFFSAGLRIALYDELVLYNPTPTDVFTLDRALYGKDATGASPAVPVKMVQFPLDDQSPNAVGASSELPIGRVFPNDNYEVPVTFFTTWAPLPDNYPHSTGSRVVVSGEHVEVAYRFTNTLYQKHDLQGFTRSLDDQGNLVIPSIPRTNAYIQFRVTFTDRRGYLDSINVVDLHRNADYANQLPKHKNLMPFTQSPILISTSEESFFLDEDLIGCTTVDTNALESTLEFDLPLNHAKVPSLQPENSVTFRGKLYKIRGITYQDTSREPKCKVHCERLWYDLLYSKEIPASHWVATPEECAMILLANTGWRCGYVESSPIAQHQWKITEKTSVISAIKELAQQYSLEVSIDDHMRTVHLLQQAGRSGPTLYLPHLQSARKRVDSTNLITRVYGVNAIGDDISPANNGVPYLEDTTWTKTIRQLTYHFIGPQTPSAMKAFLQTYLATRSKPRISYEVELGDVLALATPGEVFEVLDRLDIRDDNLNQVVASKITEMHMDWCNLANSRITLSNKLRTLSSPI